MNPFEMVVLIVAIVVIGRIYLAKHGRKDGGMDAENARLRAEIAELKDRIATLERIAVDKRHRLAEEIDALGPDR